MVIDSYVRLSIAINSRPTTREAFRTRDMRMIRVTKFSISTDRGYPKCEKVTRVYNITLKIGHYAILNIFRTCLPTSKSLNKSLVKWSSKWHI